MRTCSQQVNNQTKNQILILVVFVVVVTSGGTHLRSLTSGQQSSEERRSDGYWPAVGDTVSGMTGPGFELQAYNDALNH